VINYVDVFVPFYQSSLFQFVTDAALGDGNWTEELLDAICFVEAMCLKRILIDVNTLKID
jgi:hypothetical protein